MIAGFNFLINVFINHMYNRRGVTRQNGEEWLFKKNTHFRSRNFEIFRIFLDFEEIWWGLARIHKYIHLIPKNTSNIIKMSLGRFHITTQPQVTPFSHLHTYYRYSGCVYSSYVDLGYLDASNEMIQFLSSK